MYLRKIQVCLVAIALFLTGSNLRAAAGLSLVQVSKTKDGWVLLVDGKPYLVKGMCYWPVKIGETPDDGSLTDWTIQDTDKDGRIDSPEQSWVDRNHNNKKDADEPEAGDFRLLEQMGCNTIRMLHHASADPAVQALNQGDGQYRLYNHAPNKALLRKLFKTYGIRVAMGDLLGAYTVASGAEWDAGTDYTNEDQKRRMLLSVESMVKEFKDEPYILMWILGNENSNYADAHTNAAKNPAAYGDFVNEVAKRIHKLDPRHPVAICEFDGIPMKKIIPHLPDVDIIGVNTFRSLGFGTLWKELARLADKPILVTQYGVATPKLVDGVLDEDHHASVYAAGWKDIKAHAKGGDKEPAASIGGFVFEWTDNWWQDGDAYEQNTSPTWNHEICGVASQGSGQHSPFQRVLRKTYYALQELWTQK